MTDLTDLTQICSNNPDQQSWPASMQTRNHGNWASNETAPDSISLSRHKCVFLQHFYSNVFFFIIIIILIKKKTNHADLLTISTHCYANTTQRVNGLALALLFQNIKLRQHFLLLTRTPNISTRKHFQILPVFHSYLYSHHQLNRFTSWLVKWSRQFHATSEAEYQMTRTFIIVHYWRCKSICFIPCVVHYCG